MFIQRICSALTKENIPYAIVGGFAVALHGLPRGTFDLDIVIRWTEKNLTKAEASLNNCGLISRLPISAKEIFEFRDEYIENRNLIAWNFYNPMALNEQVDLLINFDLGRKKVISKVFSNTPLQILNIKDLIKMKIESGREQDLADVQGLEKLL